MRAPVTVLALIATWLFAGSAGADPHVVPSRYRLQLQLIPRVDVAPAALDLALAEAASIWRPYGIDVAWSTEPPAPDDWDIFVRVILDDDPGGDPHRVRVGSIPFVGADVPLDVITLSPAGAGTLLGRTALRGRTLIDQPLQLRYQFLGQALGRSLAHELGHYLLATPDHTQRGLMRPTFSTQDLLDTRRARFTLTPGEVEQVRRRLAVAFDGCTAGGR